MIKSVLCCVIGYTKLHGNEVSVNSDTDITSVFKLTVMVTNTISKTN